MKCKVCGQDNPPIASFCADCGGALVATVEQPIPVAPGSLLGPVVAIEYIGFFVRFSAAVIDAIVIWLLFSVLFYFLGTLPTGYWFISYYMSWPWLFLLYHWFFTGLKGQTPGKMALGIKVVNAQGNRPGLASAALREILGKLVSTIIFFLGFLWIAGDRQKQGWHDKLAATYVIKVETGR